jgi:hypothetical protein
MTVILRNRRGVMGILFLVAVAGWAAAQTDKPAPRPLDSLKNLPPGAIIVVCDDLNAGQKLAANLILLTPKQYQDMRDEIAQSKAKSRPEEIIPGECKLTGAVEGDVIRFHVEFKFVTERDREQVLLACRLGRPTAVSLDGNLPVVHPTNRGLVLVVEKKGEHAAKLDLEVGIGPKGDRGSERGFELDLPGAAVTNLELAMPESVAEAAVGVSTPAGSLPRLVATTAEGGQRRLKRFLGPATSLEVSWKGPVAAASGQAQRTAQGTIMIRVSEGQYAADVEWRLKARGQPVAEWRLHVPENARVMVNSPGGEDRPTVEIETPSGADKTLRVLRLKEPTFDTLTVVAQVELQRGQNPVPVGPFAVEGADWQRGDVLISALADVSLRIIHRGLLSPREVAADELRRDKDTKAAFTYWSLPAPEKAGGPYPPLLELADSSRASIEARAEHYLQRSEESWKLRTVLHITPPAAGIDSLNVQLPAEYRLQPPTPRSDEPAYSIKADGNASIAEVKLAQRATQPFDLTLEGAYIPAPMPRSVLLKLPLLQQAQGRGPNKVVIQLLDNQEFGTQSERDPAWEIAKSRYNRQTWTSDRVPASIEFTWQPHRQENLLKSEADVALSSHDGKVVQKIWFASGQSTAETRFRVPEEITGLEVLDGGEWNAKTRIVTLARGLGEKSPLRLKYSFSIRGELGDTILTVPLPAPAQDVHCETKLRITCDSPSLVELVRGPWEELPLESSPEGKRLANLVLHGERPEDPPTLAMKEGTALASVGLERTLIRASVNEQGQQSYRASFVLNPSSTRYLDFEFPAPPTALNVRVELDGLLATWKPLVDTAQPPYASEPQRIARVSLGVAPRAQTMIDVWYQIAPGQLNTTNPSWARGIGPLKTVLYPPRLCGYSGQASVRWQVMLPSDWVPLYDDGALPADLTWAWRGWLVGTRPYSSTTDLEQWLDPSNKRPPADGGDIVYPSVAGWRSDLEPLVIRHAPQQGWLLGCSVALLAAALCFYFARSSRWLLWLLLTAVVVALLTVAVVWSGALSAVLYGCEPGLAALIIIVTVQWLLQRRYRRQIVFLPSFKRVKTEGSVVTSNGGVNRPREPSTVDALPPVPSGQWATGGPTPSAARAQLPGSSKTKLPPG